MSASKLSEFVDRKLPKKNMGSLGIDKFRRFRAAQIGNYFLHLVLLCAVIFMASCTKPVEKWEMVIYAKEGQIENTHLELNDIDQHVMMFTVAHPRRVQVLPLQLLVNKWDFIFKGSEPNATLSMVTAQKEQKEQVIILRKPELLNDRLTFTIDQSSSPFVGKFQNAVLFIDSAGGYATPPGQGGINCIHTAHMNFSWCPN